MLRNFTVFAVFLFACTTKAATPTAQVRIDGRKIVRQLPRFAQFPNTSIIYAPPSELAERTEREYGRPQIIRCWLTLDDMWDFRDGKYYFDYPLGYDRYKDSSVRPRNYVASVAAVPNLSYYDYLGAFSGHSNVVLLNVRRYENEVLGGVISMEKWKEVLKAGLRHYKQRYGSIVYIESLNEYELAGFGGLTDDQYYSFYKATYEVVNDLNDELKPDVPLQVGGPCVTGGPLSADGPKQERTKGFRIYRFLQNYAKDPNPRKRLDFVSFHEYALRSNPAAIAQYASIVRGWLRENGISENLPLFDTEIGMYAGGVDPRRNQEHATGVSSLFYWTRDNTQHRLFPWVLMHNPALQLCLTGYLPDMRMTPFGAMLKMWALQKKDEVETIWEQQPVRVQSVATTDEGGMAIQMWNDSAVDASAHIMLSSLPPNLSGKVRLREYRIDSKHSNCLLVPSAKAELEMVRQEFLSTPSRQWDVSLEPYSLVLWLIEPVK